MNVPRLFIKNQPCKNQSCKNLNGEECTQAIHREQRKVSCKNLNGEECTQAIHREQRKDTCKNLNGEECTQAIHREQRKVSCKKPSWRGMYPGHLSKVASKKHECTEACHNKIGPLRNGLSGPNISQYMDPPVQIL